MVTTTIEMIATLVQEAVKCRMVDGGREVGFDWSNQDDNVEQGDDWGEGDGGDRGVDIEWSNHGNDDVEEGDDKFEDVEEDEGGEYGDEENDDYGISMKNRLKWMMMMIYIYNGEVSVCLYVCNKKSSLPTVSLL